MSEQDTDINYLALALVLTHSKNDKQLLLNARRATTILHSSDKSLANGHDYKTTGLSEFRPYHKGAQQPNNREV